MYSYKQILQMLKVAAIKYRREIPGNEPYLGWEQEISKYINEFTEAPIESSDIFLAPDLFVSERVFQDIFWGE